MKFYQKKIAWRGAVNRKKLEVELVKTSNCIGTVSWLAKRDWLRLPDEELIGRSKKARRH